MAESGLSVRFGALAPSLAEQLDRKPKECELWQKDADAITRLLVRNLLSDASGRKARQRLLSRIGQATAGGKG